MTIAVKISDELVSKAEKTSGQMNRSVAGQIEYWAKMGQILEDNPDLSFNFVKEVLMSQQEIESGDVNPYEFAE